MRTWLVERSELTKEQLKIVEAPLRKHLLVSGPASSGKTQILVHRAAYLAEAASAHPSSGFLFAITDVAQNFMRSSVKALGLHDESVTTFDEWCRSFYTAHISANLPRVYVDGRVDYARTREEVLDLFFRREDLRENLSFALVDDGQDLSPEVYRILGMSARHITVFTDPLQRIKKEGASETFILETLGAEKREIPFLRNRINPTSIIRLASCFLESEDAEQKCVAPLSPTKELEEQPLCYVAPTNDDEEERLAAVVQQRQFLGERVGIIVPKNAHVHKLAKEFLMRGVKVEKAIVSDAQNVIHQPFDFNNNIPKITTFPLSKGLAFDSVMLPHLTEDSFRGLGEESRLRMLFVGIMRASRWVYLSTVRGHEFKEFSILRGAEKKSCLIME